MYKSSIYSEEVCNERIEHWNRQIEILVSKKKLTPKQESDLKTNKSLLQYWKNFKDKHYGKKNDLP